MSRQKRTAGEKRVACARKPIEQKESFRWLEMARHCQGIKEHLPKTQLIMLADRDARDVTVSVHCGQVTLNDPRPRHKDGITVNAVLVHEPNPPENEQPIEWLLLTSLPINTREDVARIVAYYEQRWTIELLFKVLKSGCKIESRRFEHIDRFLPALGLYLIIAWRAFTSAESAGPTRSSHAKPFTPKPNGKACGPSSPRKLCRSSHHRC